MSARTDSTKARLYEAALELISEHGVAATTVDAIVERAGVAKGTVYYHFPQGKAQLVESMIEAEFSSLAEAFSSAVEGLSDGRERLRELVRIELEWIRDNKPFAKVLVTELWREDRVWRDTLVVIRQRILAYMRDAVADGVASGRLRSGIDPDFAASALFGMTVTSALDWLVFSPQRDIESVLEQIESLVSAATGV